VILQLGRITSLLGAFMAKWWISYLFFILTIVFCVCCSVYERCPNWHVSLNAICVSIPSHSRMVMAQTAWSVLKLPISCKIILNW